MKRGALLEPTLFAGGASIEPRLIRSLHGLLGDSQHSDSWTMDHVTSLSPPVSYDSLLRTVSYVTFPSLTHFVSDWSRRALTTVSRINAARKYKPVHRKVRPVPTYMPNPSAQKFVPITIPDIDELPVLPPKLIDFIPTERLTRERLDNILRTVTPGFLSPSEIDLLVFVLVLRQKALAWTDDERGTFKQEYYPDYEIPTIEHIPWIEPPMRVPKAIEGRVRDLIRKQESAGKFEYSSASYRSQVFAILKKSGALRLLHQLEPMNRVVIRDSALPPRLDDFTEGFIGCFIYMIADLLSGYDGRRLAEASRDLTTFHTIEGPKRLTVLPQGYCNSVAEFQRCIRHCIQPEIPQNADPFIDDVGIKGPKTDYGGQTIQGNEGIRRFVYEFATTVNRVLLRFETAGITASGSKLILATPKLLIVGTIVSRDGWHFEHGLVSKIQKWPYCESVSEVRGFLGTAGVGRKWVKGFSLIAKPLTLLCRKTDDEFTFGEDQKQAMDRLKELITKAPVLKTIDYDAACSIRPAPRDSDHGLITLAVDSSVHGSGWILYQHLEIDKHPILFGS